MKYKPDDIEFENLICGTWYGSCVRKQFSVASRFSKFVFSILFYLILLPVPCGNILQVCLIQWGGGHLNSSVARMHDKRNAKEGCFLRLNLQIIGGQTCMVLRKRCPILILLGVFWGHIQPFLFIKPCFLRVQLIKLCANLCKILVKGKSWVWNSTIRDVFL